MKETIVQAAMNLFARKGYAGTSMREIAETVKITKAALYYHFPDKDALYRETRMATSGYLNAQVEEAARGIEDAVTRIRTVVHAKLRLYVEEGDLMRFLYIQLFMPEDPSTTMSHEIRESERELKDAITACAKEGYLKAEDVETTTTLLTGAVEYCGARWLLDPSTPRPSPTIGDRLLASAIPALSSRLEGAPRRRWVKKLRKRGGRTVAGLAMILAFLLGVGASAAQDAPSVAGSSKAVSSDADTFGAHNSDADTFDADNFDADNSDAVDSDADSFDADNSDAVVVAIPGDDTILSVEECVSEAMIANASLQAVRTQKDELNAIKLQAISTGLPSIDLMGSWNRSRDPSFALDETFGGSGGFGSSIPDTCLEGCLGEFIAGLGSLVPAPDAIPPQTFWRASVNATWELRPGRVINAIGAAGHRLRQHDVVVEDSEHQTAESVVHAYYDVVSAAERLDALQAEAEARREFLDITRRRMLVEFATALDTLQAAVSLANLNPQLRRARQDLRNSGTRLNVLMGRPALTPIAVRGDPEVPPEEIDPEWALSRAEERPDIVRLKLEEAALRKTRATQKATNHPYLSMDASYGYVGRTIDTVTDKGHDFWNARVAVFFPIFDGLLTKGQAQETAAKIRRTRREREDALRQARLEILTLLGDLEAARQNREAADLNLVRAEDALSRMQQRYSLGKAEYLEILNAVSERFTARSEQIAARSEVLKLTASVRRALGLSPLPSMSGNPVN